MRAELPQPVSSAKAASSWVIPCGCEGPETSGEEGASRGLQCWKLEDTASGSPRPMSLKTIYQ